MTMQQQRQEQTQREDDDHPVLEGDPDSSASGFDSAAAVRPNRGKLAIATALMRVLEEEGPSPRSKIRARTNMNYDELNKYERELVEFGWVRRITKADGRDHIVADGVRYARHVSSLLELTQTGRTFLRAYSRFFRGRDLPPFLNREVR